MRSNKYLVLLLLVLVIAAVGALLINECDFTGGMGASDQACDCLGAEWELYDRTEADGPRKSICIGLVQSRRCFQYVGGPEVACPPP